MKRNFLLLLLILALLTPISCAAEVATDASAVPGTIEGPGFDSPQKAALAYIEAYNAGDVSGMLSTFAIETYVDHVDRPSTIARTMAFSVNRQDTLPMPSPYVRDLLVLDRCGLLTQQLIWQFLYYAWPEAYEDNRVFLKVDFPSSEHQMEEIQDFLRAFGESEVNSWIGNISFVGFESLEQVIGDGYYCEPNENIIRRMTEVRGCDMLEELSLRIRINGRDYRQFLECARYGDRWYVQDLGGYAAMYAGVDPYVAGLIPVDG